MVASRVRQDLRQNRNHKHAMRATTECIKSCQRQRRTIARHVRQDLQRQTHLLHVSHALMASTKTCPNQRHTTARRALLQWLLLIPLNLAFFAPTEDTKS
jgi:hypothetical protein